MTRTRVLRALLVLLLVSFYVAAAKEHGTRVNTSKARGDQSGYLLDAEDIYANWHGRQPPTLIGGRNRMPLYGGFLALSYRPTMTSEQFFQVGKRRNIYLSLVLLALLYWIFRRFHDTHAAINLLLITAFGSFIFRAGYSQSELLFYFLFFVAFVLFFQLIRARYGVAGSAWRALAAGIVAALAHLTKASVLPLVGIALVVLAAKAYRAFRDDRRECGRLLLVTTLVATSFLAVLSPYLLENKRTFGRYFYNVNTTFYVWYNDWPEASFGTIKYGDGVGWPKMLPSDLPSASKYWREHSLAMIATRFGNGFLDMFERSLKTFRYLPYVVAYLIFAVALMMRRRTQAAALMREHRFAVVFIGLYAVVYAFGIAFYEPVSGTGTTRFLMAHLLPAFLVLSLVIAHRWGETIETWRIGRLSVTADHFHYFISALLAFDIVFTIWPKMMTTYSGF